jgi:2-polyprenyl-3-methyl-5-hydroxy-6-metoxy-1,4-benzoquinol methylase
MSSVDWSIYATQYDLMAERNPAYQDLLRHCVDTVQRWLLRAGDVLADFGAGTGNFSIALARAFPMVTVLHLEFDEQMLTIAGSKAKQAGLGNWLPIRLDLEGDNWDLPPLAGAVTVHCLYSTKRPRQLIHRICSQLAPGRHLYACDFGRVMNVMDWARYLIGASLFTRGFFQTLTLVMRSGIIRKQNRLVAQAQREGTYWTHNLAEFRSCFEHEGITVTEASDRLYRGYDDLVVGRKGHLGAIPDSSEVQFSRRSFQVAASQPHHAANVSAVASSWRPDQTNAALRRTLQSPGTSYKESSQK